MELISSDVFDRWLDKLQDRQARLRILHALARCEAHEQMLGDIKQVGKSVSEIRFHFGAGYRVYFTQIGNMTIFLLAGGDKSTQKRDIEIAQQMALEIRRGRR